MLVINPGSSGSSLPLMIGGDEDVKCWFLLFVILMSALVRETGASKSTWCKEHATAGSDVAGMRPTPTPDSLEYTSILASVTHPERTSQCFLNP